MTLRIDGLADLDPSTVPLPIGTDVMTLVDRDGRTQGAYGRVSKLDGERVDVTFLDDTHAVYLRVEIAPRKLGIARYAARSAAAWDELRPCVAIDTVVGSRAWGLATEASDEDHRGVFVLPLAWTTGLVDPPVDLISADGCHQYWEVGKAIRQALRADPATLEMLFADVNVVDPIGEPFVAMRNGFLSQDIYGAFGRYALSQLDRIEHNARLADHRATVISWLRDNPTLGLDTAAERLADVAHVEAPTRRDAVLRARDYLKQLYRSMYDQGHIAANDWVSLRVAAKHDLPVPRDPRPKNAYNLIRLLDLGIRWLSGEPPSVRVPDALRPTLLAIKQGEVPMLDVMALAKELTPKLEAAREKSRLPKRGDVAAADKVLRDVRAEAARRAIHLVPGPWGEHAIHPPEAHFADET